MMDHDTWTLRPLLPLELAGKLLLDSAFVVLIQTRRRGIMAHLSNSYHFLNFHYSHDNSGRPTSANSQNENI